jgi:hypothetical protein
MRHAVSRKMGLDREMAAGANLSADVALERAVEFSSLRPSARASTP